MSKKTDYAPYYLQLSLEELYTVSDVVKLAITINPDLDYSKAVNAIQQYARRKFQNPDATKEGQSAYLGSTWISGITRAISPEQQLKAFEIVKEKGLNAHLCTGTQEYQLKETLKKGKHVLAGTNFQTKIAIHPKAAPSLPFGKIQKKLWMSLVFVLLLAFCAAVASGSYWRWIGTLENKGFPSAKKELASIEDKGDQEYYQEAWLHYQERHFTDARASLEMVKGHRFGPQKDYLSGLIFKEEGFVEQARHHFESSLVQFRELNQKRNEYRTRSELAMLSIIGKDYIGAEQSLHSLLNEFKGTLDEPDHRIIGRIWRRLAFISLLTGQKEEARLRAKKSVDTYELCSSRLMLGEALSLQAYAALASRDLTTGVELALRAEDIFVELGATSQYRANKLNFAFAEQIQSNKIHPRLKIIVTSCVEGPVFQLLWQQVERNEHD